MKRKTPMAKKEARNSVPYLNCVGHAIACRLLAVIWLGSLAFGGAVVADDEPAAPAKTVWEWEQPVIPRVFVMEGTWYEWFRIDETTDRLGVRQAWELKDLPKSSVIVIMNVPASQIPVAQVRDFVSRGGGLVVLGGMSGYNNSGYINVPLLKEILPVTLDDSYIDDYATAPNGAKLTPAEHADWPLTFDFQAGPTAYYFHTLVPKKDAKVQVKVGNQPAFVTGTYGKGRVVACSLTVNGKPAAGVVPFWDWKDWTGLFGEAIEWAGGARPAGKMAAVNQGPADVKPLTADEIQSVGLELNELPKDFVKRGVAFPNARIAPVLFDLATPTMEEPKCSLDAVLAAVLPYARPEWGARLKPLAEETNPNLNTRQAALTLLGACHEPSAYPALLRALDDPRMQLAAIDGLGWLGDARAIPILKGKFDEALDPARLPAGPHRWQPDAFAKGSLAAAHAAMALYRLGDSNAMERISDYIPDLNLYIRIMRVASNRAARDPNGIAIVKSFIAETAIMQQAWDYMADNLVPIPAAQAGHFISSAVPAEDPALVGFFADALERSVGRAPKADWSALAHARSGVIVKTGAALSRSLK